MGARAREGGDDVIRNITAPSRAVVVLGRRRSRRRRRTRCTGTTTAKRQAVANNRALVMTLSRVGV